MIKTILFDVDGVVLLRHEYWSKRFAREFQVSEESVREFFKNDYPLCATGKADLKEVLKQYLDKWHWHKTVEELIAYWFEGEKNVNTQLLVSIDTLRERGVKCYLVTDNEKYRTGYIWETVSLKDHFDGIYSSCDVGYTKERSEFWQAVYEKLGKPEQSSVLVLDDDQENVAIAKQYGFLAELYTSFEGYEKKMEQILA